MSPEYLGCSDILEIKKAGDTMDHSLYHEKNSYETLYEPSSPATECRGCMQNCTGIWGTLYDPVNVPGPPFLCANRLVPEDTV